MPSALYYRSTALEALGRQEDAADSYGELITRFGEATPPSVRVLVSWALSKEAQLLTGFERPVDAAPLLDQLVARGDEQHDPELADSVAWALQVRASQLGEEGRPDEEVVLLEELVRRFESTELDAVRSRVATALSSRAWTLGQLGRRDEQVAASEELIAIFGSTDDPGLRKSVVDAFRSKGVALDELGRSREALDSYDAGLSLLAGMDPADQAHLPRVLLSKGVSLERANRPEEAVVVFDSAVAGFSDLANREGGSPYLMARAAQSVLYKIGALGSLGRSAEAGLAVSQIESLLPADGIRAEAGAAERPEDDPQSDADLAELLADTHGDITWDALITGGDNESSRRELAARALEIYRRTQPWLEDDEEPDEEARENDDEDGLEEGDDFDSDLTVAAALTLRGVADCFAMLSRGWTPNERASLPFINRPQFEWTLHLSGLDEWAAELGHGVDLSSDHEAIDEQVDEERDKDQPFERKHDFATAFVVALRRYECLVLLSDTQQGREALQTTVFQWLAPYYISEARKWASWTGLHLEDAVALGIAMLLISQAWFIAARGAIDPTADAFPGTELLRGLIRTSDGFEWLEAQDVVLPVNAHPKVTARDRRKRQHVGWLSVCLVVVFLVKIQLMGLVGRVSAALGLDLDRLRVLASWSR